MRCYQRLLSLLYKDNATNEEVQRKIRAAVEEYGELLNLVKKRGTKVDCRVSGSSGLIF